MSNTEGKDGGEFLKARTAAKRLDMSVRWVKERVKEQQLDGYRVGQEVLVSVASINRFMADRRIAPPQ